MNMDVSAFLDFIAPSMLVLIFVLYIIGVFLKKIPNIPDWLIPFIILFLAIAFAFAMTGFAVEAVIQGILIAGVVVLGNELIKQGTIKRKE